jgi:hypothetical protein
LGEEEGGKRREEEGAVFIFKGKRCALRVSMIGGSN